jgi:serine/threonine-protein kinase
MSVLLAIGEEFAGHRIEGLIGRGGMGVVYVAEHLRLGRKVAIKVLDPDLASDESFRRRFIRESQLAATLEHRNIVQVYDAGEVGNVAYISMRLVDGMDLSALLRAESPLASDRALSINEQIAAALDAAHAQGLVHRDVKPANILLEPVPEHGEERAFLSDFGITKHVASDRTTEEGQFIGTIDYMAPEQIRGDILDGRADEYSLACVLFECLTGKVPYPRDEQLQVLYAHMLEPPPHLTGHGTQRDRRLDEVVRRGMAKRPDERFPTCSDLIAGCREALGAGREGSVPVGAVTDGKGPDTPAARRPGPRHRGMRRRRTRSIVAALVAVVIAASAVTAIVLQTTGANRSGGRTGSTPTAGGGLGAPSSSQTDQGPTSPTAPTPPTAALTALPVDISWDHLPLGRVFGGSGDQGINRAFATQGSKVVAVGYEVPNPSKSTNFDVAIWYSPDGRQWVRAIFNSEPGNMAAVGYEGNNFVAVGTVLRRPGDHDGAVWTSTDGVVWDREPGSVFVGPGDQEIHRLFHWGSRLWAVGFDSRTGTRDAAVWEFDGTNWSPKPFAAFGGPGDQEMWGATPFGAGAVAVGSDGSGNGTDAAVWIADRTGQWHSVDPSQFAEPGVQVMKTVVVVDGQLVAMGSDNGPGSNGADAAVWTSGDGSTWTRVPESQFVERGHQEIEAALPIGTGVVAVGEGGVWTSRDLTTWDNTYHPSPSASEIDIMKGIVQAGGRLVVVGHSRVDGEGSAAVWVGTPTTATPSPT